MAVTLPREGRYKPRSAQWEEARRRLEAEPGEWVMPLDERITKGSASWLRRSGPIALRDIREEVEYRLRETRVVDGKSASGVLYARYTPGVKAPAYKSGLLSDEEVRAAREEYAAGEISQQSLAEKYGMSLTGMNGILNGHYRVSAGGPLGTKEQV